MVVSGQKIIYSCQRMKSLVLNLKQDLTTPTLKKYLLVQEEAGKKPIQWKGIVVLLIYLLETMS